METSNDKAPMIFHVRSSLARAFQFIFSSLSAFNYFGFCFVVFFPGLFFVFFFRLVAMMTKINSLPLKFIVTSSFQS